jgi:hypothetical protein
MGKVFHELRKNWKIDRPETFLVKSCPWAPMGKVFLTFQKGKKKRAYLRDLLETCNTLGSTHILS